MTERPRWLLVALDYPPAGGGISRLLQSLVEHSADEIDWRIVTTTAGTRADAVRRVSPSRLMPAVVEGLRWARRCPEGRVVIGHPFLATPVLAAARLARIPSSALVYGLEAVSRDLSQKALMAGLRGVDQVLCISGSTAQQADRLGVPVARTVVVHPALSGKRARTECRQPARSRGLRLVVVTRMAEYYKNIELLHAVLLVLKSSGAVERCVVVGDGPLRVGYEREARRAGLGAVLCFPGRLSDEEVASVVDHSDVGLFPSRASSAEGGFEGFGLVIHELASAGLPVLVGDAAGAREAAGEGWSMLLDPEDVGAWAMALHSLWREPERLKDLATAAEQWAADADPARTVARMVAGLRG